MSLILSFVYFELRNLNVYIVCLFGGFGCEGHPPSKHLKFLAFFLPELDFIGLYKETEIIVN